MNEQHDHTASASESPQPPLSVARGLLMTVTLWVPLGILLAGLIVLLAWLPRLPADVAIHWGPDGNADGFAAPWVLIAAYLATSGLFIAISAWSTLAGVRSLARFDGPADAPRSGLPRTVRLSAVIGPSGVLFVTVMFLGSTAPQLDGRGGADPGTSLLIILLCAAAAALIVGALAAAVLPAAERSARVPSPEPAIALAPGEAAVWTSTVMSPWPVFALIGGVMLAALIPLIITPQMWLYTVIMVVVLALLATTLCARVTIDERGLRVRTPLRVRVLFVPLDDVVSAAEVRVTAAEFGGWGFRFDGDGRRGFIARSGSAIQVERRAGESVVVTVPDARTGAALLNGLVAARGSAVQSAS